MHRGDCQLNMSAACTQSDHGPQRTRSVDPRAVAIGPVLAGPTFRADGCGKRQSARAMCAHGAGGGEIEQSIVHSIIE